MTQKRRRRGENRDQLMEAALSLVGRGRHFASLGIREVTREAGVVPTAFYRHFRNMDDLGLQLVDQLGLVLRRLMREARQNVQGTDRLIEQSIRIFVEHVLANRAFFLFMAQGLAGESRAVGEGVRSEMHYFAHELANDLRRLKVADHLDEADMMMVCELVVRTVSASLTDLLVISPEETQRIDNLKAQMVRSLQLIFVGVRHWRSGV